MFNKSNLFHKTADTPVTRTTPRPTGSSGTSGSVLAAAEPVSAAAPAASTEVSSKPETAATESPAPVAAAEGTSESRLIVGPEAEGLFTLFALMFFLIGLALFGIGLLGEYVGRVYQQVRHRPRYLVDAILERDVAKPQ